MHERNPDDANLLAYVRVVTWAPETLGGIDTDPSVCIPYKSSTNPIRRANWADCEGNNAPEGGPSGSDNTGLTDCLYSFFGHWTE